jgi:KamA family protein
LPFKCNNYIVDELINWDDVDNDPVFTLTFPQKQMLASNNYEAISALIKKKATKDEVKQAAQEIRNSLNPQPAGQLSKNVPELEGVKLTGIQHKYKQTMLFFPANGQTCHAYCTFCFRWPQFTGVEAWKFAMRETELMIEYIKRKPEITDVLFTGGDPMIMSAKMLGTYIKPLINAGLPNLKTIRIGSKSLSFWPYKFTQGTEADDILKLFESIVNKGIHLAFMAHFSHPVELSTPVVQQAIQRIRSTGAIIRTQSPILRHINDAPDIWADMWKKQVALGCIPYYMFIARDTGAQEYFAVPLVRSWEIFREAYQNVSGICRTVRGPSMSCTPGKIQILGVSEIPGLNGNEKVITLRFIQGRNPDWAAKPFFAEYNDAACWITDLKPAFGEKKFFFEEASVDNFSTDFFENDCLANMNISEFM